MVKNSRFSETKNLVRNDLLIYRALGIQLREKVIRLPPDGKIAIRVDI
jgi:hypothetical protein